jgi:hypothetical protein
LLQSLPFIPTKAGRVLSLCENHVHSLELAALAVPNVDGYNPYFLADYARYAHRTRREAAPAFEHAFPRIGDEPTLPDLVSVSALNVTEIVSCEPLTDDALRPIARSGVLYVYANMMATGRVMPELISQRCSEFQPGPEPLEVHPSTDDRTVSIGAPIADRPDGVLRFWFSASRPHLLLLSEPFYPERRARIDSRDVPVYKANTALSAVCVDEGTHVIELRYVPTALWLGTAVSAATIVIWFSASVLTRRRAQRGEGGVRGNRSGLSVKSASTSSWVR